MKTGKIIALAALLVAASGATPVGAQSEKTIKIEDVTVINDGDGRALFRDAKSEAPLNGLHRIIDGVHSAYVLAEFADGFYNGSHETYKNSSLATKGTYREGRLNGPFTTYRADGTVEVELTFADGKMDGTATGYYPDGKIEQQQEYTEGKLDGMSRDYYLDGQLAAEQGFRAGKEHGPERKFREGEQKPYVDRNWFEGQPDGRQYAEIDSNTGDYIQVAHYERGTPVGEFLQTWADSGEVKQRGSYKDGKREGVWTSIRRDGKIESETTYAGGKRNGPSKTFFSDNSVEKITMYADDKREGVERTFRYEGGRPASEFNYVNDRLEGDYKRWYDDEKPTLREEGRISRGNEVYRKEYYADGKLRRIQERPASGGTWKTIESHEEE